MLQIHLTPNAAEELAHYLSDEGEITLNAMQWYGDAVTLMGRRCIIIVERRSRYAILFSSLSDNDLTNFPELFYRRLWREVMSLCRPEGEQADALQLLIDETMARQQYRSGIDRVLQSEIDGIAALLNEMASQIGALPDDSYQEFLFGMKVNERPVDGDEIPRNRFRELWLGRLGEEPDGAPPANVVPFRPV